ncbi:hypothetical protein [Streptomyces mirabilis]|uniref:hypothetical protein n=1 Tax=Streptomyces mirabilis TaxID=68239 RepID=UPI0033AE59F7
MSVTDIQPGGCESEPEHGDDPAPGSPLVLVVTSREDGAVRDGKQRLSHQEQVSSLKDHAVLVERVLPHPLVLRGLLI